MVNASLLKINNDFLKYIDGLTTEFSVGNSVGQFYDIDDGGVIDYGFTVASPSVNANG